MQFSRSAAGLFMSCLALIAPALVEAAVFELARDKTLPVEMETKPTGPYKSTPYTASRDRVWRQVISYPFPARFLRAEIQVRQSNLAVPWRVIIKDQDGVEHDRIEGRPGMTGIFWTDEVPGQVIVLELWTDGDPTGLELVVENYAYSVLRNIPQSVSGRDQRIPITEALEPVEVRSWGTAVARLRFMTTRTDGSLVASSCSGFLLGKDLLITNYHCIRGDLEAQSAVVELGYDTYAAAVERFRIAKLEVPAPELDYSIVQLTGVPSERFQPARPATANPPANRLYFRVPAQLDPNFRPIALGLPQDLVIIEHPSGKPKQVSLDDCRIAAPLVPGVAPVNGGNTDFSHTCDTLGGSSGSPVINLQTGEIVGLHHLGAEQGVTDPVNQAVYFSAILNDLGTRDQNRYRSLYRQITEVP